ncbi:MAG: ADP-ribosylglycohydrolase family protein [Lachnospiraceae bacterium]|nr:ADP-ribosylglycohydrolase family protein [Lachnospiraceae bacterium]
MTLFTAEGILLAKNPMNYTAYISGMFDAYQEWLRTQRFSRKVRKNRLWLTDIKELNDRRAPGITCLNALERGEFGSIYEPINNSKGCGGVMRVAPIGLYYSPDEMEWQEIDTRGAQAAALTHGHPLGYISAAGLVHIVNLAMYRPEMSLLQIMEDMIEKVPVLFMDDDPEECEIFKNLMRKAVDLATDNDITDDLDAIHKLGEGWIGEEALAIAVYCALKHDNDFDAAMISSVNHNGDSDSTGAIAGNILGTYLGIDAIPDKYTENLELIDIIRKVAENLRLLA